jgi:cytochrome bd-type quinol oxidase subunit 2
MKGKSYVLIDTDNDGKISSEDIDNSNKILDLQEKGSKFSNQTKMAWISLAGMLVLTAVLFFPFIDVERVKAIAEFISMLYISLSGIVATYMGVSAWVYQKNKDANSN